MRKVARLCSRFLLLLSISVVLLSSPLMQSIVKIKIFPVSAAETLIDSYIEGNHSSGVICRHEHPSVSDDRSAAGQSFRVYAAYNITKVVFYMRGNGAPTVNVTACLYNATTAWGVPDTLLATSDALNTTNLGDWALWTFNFSAPYTEVETNGYYCIVAQEAAAGGTIDVDNFFQVSKDNSSPSHEGSGTEHQNAAWESESGYDTIFYVYGEPVPYPPALSNSYANQTKAGNATQFRVDIFDTDGLSHAWLEHNSTGSLVNQTATPLTGTSDIARFNMTMNAVVGEFIQIRWHANDTTNARGTSGFQTFELFAMPLTDLYIEGRHVRKTSDDSIVVLNGFNKHGHTDYKLGYWPRKGYDEAGINQSDYDRVLPHLQAMRALNCNVMRDQPCIEWSVTADSVQRDNLKDLANWTAMNDMYLIIVFRNVNHTSHGEKLPFPPYSSENDTGIIGSVGEWVDFWVNLVKNMSGYPNVIYELYNEPNGNSTVQTAWFAGVQLAVKAMRNYTDQIIMVQWDWTIIEGNPNNDLDWINDFCVASEDFYSYNILYSTHIYRANGFSFSDDYETLKGEYATCKVNVTTNTWNRPLWIGETGLDVNDANQTAEEGGFNVSLRILREWQIGVCYWWWWKTGVYRFHPPNIRWIPAINMSSSRIWLQNRYTRPAAINCGNETVAGIGGYYMWGNDTSWSDSWNSTTNQLNVSLASEGEARIVWSVSPTFLPVNSTLNARNSNGTKVNAINHYNSTQNLIKLGTSSGSSWLIGYNLEGASEYTYTFFEVANTIAALGAVLVEGGFEYAFTLFDRAAILSSMFIDGWERTFPLFERWALASSRTATLDVYVPIVPVVPLFTWPNFSSLLSGFTTAYFIYPAMILGIVSLGLVALHYTRPDPLTVAASIPQLLVMAVIGLLGCWVFYTVISTILGVFS